MTFDEYQSLPNGRIMANTWDPDLPWHSTVESAATRQENPNMSERITWKDVFTRIRLRSSIARPIPFLAAVGLAAVTLTACGDDTDQSSDPGDTTASGAVDVDGNAFIAESADGIELPDGSRLRIAFADGNINVTGGCNTMNGAYTIDGDVLNVAQMAMTNMACDEALMTLDSEVSELLTSGPTLSGSDETLTITGDTSLTLAQEQPMPLEATTWTVNGVIEADAVTSYAVQPTLVFESGTVSVFAGCNSGSGGVTITDSTIEFGPIALSMRACEGDAQTVEDAVIAVLDGTAEYTIAGSTLTIMNGDIGLIATGSAGE